MLRKSRTKAGARANACEHDETAYNAGSALNAVIAKPSSSGVPGAGDASGEAMGAHGSNSFDMSAVVGARRAHSLLSER